MTSLGSGYRYSLYWSPDSSRRVFIDSTKTVQLLDVDSGALTAIDQTLWMNHFALEQFRVSWSADSRWIAYSRGLENRMNAVFLYDTREERRHQVTAGF